ncbi:MAG: DUF892 family protein [Vicinamibacterales bacterium]
MSDNTLQRAFIDELREAYDAEEQLIKASRRFAKAASSPDLRKAFESHGEEAKEQLRRLEQVFKLFARKARAKRCDPIAAMIDQGKKIIESGFEKAALDAYLIAVSQRLKHYEIAVYGTLAVWARALEQEEAADLLEETLDEEKATDQELTSLAEDSTNDDAADVGQGD